MLGWHASTRYKHHYTHAHARDDGMYWNAVKLDCNQIRTVFGCVPRVKKSFSDAKCTGSEKNYTILSGCTDPIALVDRRLPVALPVQDVAKMRLDGRGPRLYLGRAFYYCTRDSFFLLLKVRPYTLYAGTTTTTADLSGNYYPCHTSACDEVEHLAGSWNTTTSICSPQHYF